MGSKSAYLFGGPKDGMLIAVPMEQRYLNVAIQPPLTMVWDEDLKEPWLHEASYRETNGPMTIKNALSIFEFWGEQNVPL